MDNDIDEQNQYVSFGFRNELSARAADDEIAGESVIVDDQELKVLRVEVGDGTVDHLATAFGAVYKYGGWLIGDIPADPESMPLIHAAALEYGWVPGEDEANRQSEGLKNPVVVESQLVLMSQSFSSKANQV